MPKQTYTYALGRRKSSTARIRLFKGKGQIVINGQPAIDYFSNSVSLLERVNAPLNLMEKSTEYDISAVVQGGGTNGQAEAIGLGIAKALVILNEDYRATLKRADLLSRDPREKERKKCGLKSARKQRQFTKR